MDFELSDEQRLLKESVGRLLAARYPDLRTRSRYQQEPDGFSRALWREYADLGLLAIPFAERHGGLGQGPVETMIVMEALGAALALEPYLATVVVGGGILRHGASAAQQAALVPGIVDGKLLLALAHVERQARHDLADVATRARQDGGGFVLDGDKTIVLAGDSADRLIVSARLSGDRRQEDGIGLFLVDPKAEGITRRGYATQDGLRAADIRLAGVRVGPEAAIGGPGAAFPILERAVHEANAALAAEAVGAMSALHALTIDYIKTRKQFGVAVGTFQAIQHKAVDMYTELEQARSMALYATMMVGEADAAERRRAMAAAKVQVGRSGRFIGETAIQLHGGIGMTFEYKAGHLLKRLAMIDLTFGSHEHHLRQLARMGGLAATA